MKFQQTTTPLFSVFLLFSVLGLAWMGATQPAHHLAQDSSCKVYLPNIFSPNGDGINDTFRAATPCPWAFYRLRVFDRWGNLVFESQDPQQGWSGKVKGQDLPTAAYAYVLEYRFEESEEQGVQVLHGEVGIVR